MKTAPAQPAQPATSTVSMSTLLTKSQVATAMGIAVRTLEGLVAAGEFPRGVRVGRCLYWTEEAVARWHQRLFAVQLAWRC